LLLVSEGWDFDSNTGKPTPTHDAMLARDELVQLATGVEDKTIYAMAIQACDQRYDPGPRDTACERISAAKWAAMDPDNAAPWLRIAAEAHEHSDPAGVADAIGHAAQAHTIDFGHDAVLSYASRGMPPETTGLERAAFLYRLIGQKGGGPIRVLALGDYCSAKAEQQTSVRQQCEAVAELMADHGRDTADVETAASLGAHLGWPAERVAAMREETLAVYAIQPPSLQEPWGCDNVHALHEFADQQGRSGQLAAARAAIGRSGKSVAELAQQQRDSVRKLEEDPDFMREIQAAMEEVSKRQ
jgi:hypothetical protein